MIGKVIDHYKIIKKIGEGGMGDVFLAEDTRLKRKVALKFLSSYLLSNERARKRFFREARTAASINHPNIVTIHDIKEYSNWIYIIMEYVKGETLQDMLTCPGTSTPIIGDDGPLSLLDFKAVTEIARQICEGLQEAHRVGIIHRDLKPGNIIIKENKVKILDFGLAKFTGLLDTSLTEKHSIVGTSYYLSPEQIKGEELDPQADIWSLGVLLYEITTGKLPFTGHNNPAIFASILNDTPIPPTELRYGLPDLLERIILKCLQKGKDYRYRTVKEISDDLEYLSGFLRGHIQDEKRQPLSAIQPSTSAKIKKTTERRFVTILYAEITGFDQLKENLDPEEYASLINYCLTLLSTTAQKYGSGINKIIGNGLTVFFGVPTAIEETPKRAINTAIDMRNCLHRLNEEQRLPIPLNIRIGINSGVVIAGLLGDAEKGEYSISGECLDIAAGLKDLASHGEVYAGSTTYKYTNEEFEYLHHKPRTIKVRQLTTNGFILLSDKPVIHRHEILSDRMIFSDMVGRENELDILNLHMLNAINGKGSIVSVIGEPGIGKSRLISEFKKLEVVRKVLLLEGRSSSYGMDISYHPVIDIIKNWTEITEDDSEMQAITRIERIVKAILPDSVDEIVPFIGTLMGIKLPIKFAVRLKGIEGEALSRLILKSLKDLLTAVSKQKPVVCILQDIHWGDISTIELVEALFILAAKHPILFIPVMRPNYPATTERIVNFLHERYNRIYREILLFPLDEQDTQTLIHHLVKNRRYPAGFVSAVSLRSGGNPFFVEEVIRSFIDKGYIEYENRSGRFDKKKEINEIEIPETIHDVLMSRIDRLDESTIQLLKTAAVIGRFFFYKILAEVTGESEGIDEQLAYLKELQVISEQRRMNEVEYFFKHALVHEVTYISILQIERKMLHLKVAEAFENLFPERLNELYGMLALHYSRGENLEKAEDYLVKAGEEALKSAASNEALTYYGEALKMYIGKYGKTGDARKIAFMKKKIGLALLHKGHMEEALKYFDEVLVFWGEKRFNSEFLSLLKLIGNLVGLTLKLYFPAAILRKIPGERENEMITIMHKRAYALSRINLRRFFVDSVWSINLLVSIDIHKLEEGEFLIAPASGVFSYSGISFRLSKKLLDFVRNCIGEEQHKAIFVHSYLSFLHYFFLGQWDGEFQYEEASVDLNLKLGDFFFSIISHQEYGIFYLEKGNFGTLDRLIKKLDNIYEVYGNELALVMKSFLLCKSSLKRRNLNDALKETKEAIEFFVKVGYPLYTLTGYALKVYLRTLTGDLAKAERNLLEVENLESQEQAINPFYKSTLLVSRMLFYLSRLQEAMRSDDRGNISHWQKRVRRTGIAAVKNTHKYAADKTEIFRLLGIYYWLIQKQRKALQWLRKSILVGERMGARLELARTYMEIGKRLLEENSKFHECNGLSAVQYLKKARVLFEEMKLGYDLAELKRIETGLR